MNDLTFWEMAIRLVISVALGGLIGLERETHGRPAGLRTHILVCLGATLYALCSYSIAGHKFDPGRVTAQIVTGIGFLGAGTIIQHGSIVRGLTTAASIWTVAAIGIAVAIGGKMLLLAVAASVVAFGTLNLVARLERGLLAKANERYLLLIVRAGHDSLCQALAILTRHGAQLRVLSSEESRDRVSQVLRVRIRVQQPFDQTALDTDLAADENVISYTWE